MVGIPQTPRRSKRFQPLATPSRKYDNNNPSTSDISCKWVGDAVFVRSSNPQTDLLPEELEKMKELPKVESDENAVDENGGSHSSSARRGGMETAFYQSFSMRRNGHAAGGTVLSQASRGSRTLITYGSSSKAKGKSRATAEDNVTGAETYHVGDTVLVETDGLYRKRKPPSVAVITAMWEPRTRGETNDAHQEGDASKMHIRIHWFLRPSELASVRAKRMYAENEIYYSLSSTEIVFPEVIVGKCLVTSKVTDPRQLQIKTQEEWLRSPKKPTRGRAPGPKRQAQVDSDDEEKPSLMEGDDGATQTFYCHLAVNSMRGLFFELDWDKHHHDAHLASSQPPDEDNADDVMRWGDGTLWDVDVAEQSTKPTASASRTKKALDTQKRPPRKKIKLWDPSDAEAAAGSENETDDGDDDDLFTAHSESEEEDEDGVSEKEVPSTADEEEDEDELFSPKTPSRRGRRKRDVSISPSKRAAATPRKPRGGASTKTLVHPTPHSKAALKARRRVVGAAEYPATPTRSSKKRKLPVRRETAALLANLSKASTQDFSHLPMDPWLRAMHALHVGNRPDALPCREEEFEKVLKCVGDLLEEGSGGCIYISGVPGTGKTATVHAIVRELKRMAEANEMNPFNYVEINGLKIPDPSAAYNLLWEAVSSHDVEKDGHLRISAKESLKALTRHFGGGGGRGRGPGGHACVVLMDELDQLVTAKQDVVYNFFNWPTLVGSKLVVIAVANTMDLPERVMTGRVRSRLGMIRINFQPYKASHLETIVHARLASAKESFGNEEGATQDVFAPDAIKFAAMKVGSISGDARRVLDICRRTVELVHGKRRVAKVGDVKDVITVMQNSPTAAYLRNCSFHERMMLASLVKCIKREGVEQIKWGEVQHQHFIYMAVLPSDSDPKRKPTPYELSLVLDSLVASRAMLVEDGPAAMRKPEAERRVVLCLDLGEVERVLSDVGGQTWKNVLST